MRTTTQNTTPQIALRNCSKEKGGIDQYASDFGEGTCNQVLRNVFTSLVELLLVKRNSGHNEDFSAFPDTRRYMNWAHKLAPENVYLKTSLVSLCLTV